MGLKLFLSEDLGWLGIGALLVEDPWVWNLDLTKSCLCCVCRKICERNEWMNEDGEKDL